MLWTHLFEPHSSYMTHKEFPTSLSGVPGLMEKYDYEIAFGDLWVKKLIDAVNELGLADNTAIVVMADHGEAWGEHKVYFHGQDLFDEQLRVPLIIAVPGQKPQVIDEPVALVDVAPTLLDLVGAPIPAEHARAQPAAAHRRWQGRRARSAAADLRRAPAGDRLAPPRDDDDRRQPQADPPHQRSPLGALRSGVGSRREAEPRRGGGIGGAGGGAEREVAGVRRTRPLASGGATRIDRSALRRRAPPADRARPRRGADEDRPRS